MKARASWHPETLDAKQIAEEVADTLAPLAAEKNVTLTVNGSGRVKAEKEHLTELIKNLAENGIRYNHSAGTVKITVTESGNKTVISVADDGIGIDDEHQSRIFERFYRVSKSRSRETGGTGTRSCHSQTHLLPLFRRDLTPLKARRRHGNNRIIFAIKQQKQKCRLQLL